MAKKKDKVRFSAILLMLLFVGLLVFGCFFLDYKIEQTFTGKAEAVGLQKDNIKFIDAYWHLIDLADCEDADKENKAIQDIDLVYYISYYDRDYSCSYQITSYSDGRASTTQSHKLDETSYSIRGLNIYNSYVITICCTDGISNACQSKKVKNYC